MLEQNKETMQQFKQEFELLYKQNWHIFNLTIEYVSITGEKLSVGDIWANYIAYTGTISLYPLNMQVLLDRKVAYPHIQRYGKQHKPVVGKIISYMMSARGEPVYTLETRYPDARQGYKTKYRFLSHKEIEQNR